MTEETAQKLIEAINNLAAKLPQQSLGQLGGGWHVYHHGLPSQQYHTGPYCTTPTYEPNYRVVG